MFSFSPYRDPNPYANPALHSSYYNHPRYSSPFLTPGDDADDLDFPAYPPSWRERARQRAELLQRQEEEERERRRQEEEQARRRAVEMAHLTQARQVYRRKQALARERVRLEAELERVRREEEAVDAQLREEEAARGRSQERAQRAVPQPSRGGSKPASSKIQPSPSPQPEARPLRTPKRPPPTEEQLAAATTIMRFYRTRKALAAIQAQQAHFETLKRAFRFPARIDFHVGGDIVSVAVPAAPPTTTKEGAERPPLAYTPANVPVHAHLEALTRVLGTLDGIESGGARAVRASRREVVRAVEAEAERVERVVGEAWEVYKGLGTEVVDERAEVADVDMKVEAEEAPLVVENSSTSVPSNAPSSSEVEVESAADVDLAQDMQVGSPEKPDLAAVKDAGPKTGNLESVSDWATLDIDNDGVADFL